MIISKIFSLSLTYKVNNITSTSKEELKVQLLNTLCSNEYMKELDIIAVDNEVTVEKTHEDEVEFLIVSYMSLNNPKTIRNVRMYIDKNANKYMLGEDSCATLIKRRVY